MQRASGLQKLSEHPESILPKPGNKGFKTGPGQERLLLVERGHEIFAKAIIQNIKRQVGNLGDKRLFKKRPADQR